MEAVTTGGERKVLSGLKSSPGAGGEWAGFQAGKEDSVRPAQKGREASGLSPFPLPPVPTCHEARALSSRLTLPTLGLWVNSGAPRLLFC